MGENKENKISIDWIEKLKMNISKYLYVKLDTGALRNVLLCKKFKQLKLREDCLRILILSNYNGMRIDVVVKCILKCKTKNGLKNDIEFQIVNCKDNVSMVLGLKTIQQLDLIRRIIPVETVHLEKCFVESTKHFSGCR